MKKLTVLYAHRKNGKALFCEAKNNYKSYSNYACCVSWINEIFFFPLDIHKVIVLPILTFFIFLFYLGPPFNPMITLNQFLSSVDFGWIFITLVKFFPLTPLTSFSFSIHSFIERIVKLNWTWRRREKW